MSRKKEEAWVLIVEDTRLNKAIKFYEIGLCIILIATLCAVLFQYCSTHL